ncbi:MAG TPA: SRPBCC domain-containing protein [Acidimicrobiales bacterium]
MADTADTTTATTVLEPVVRRTVVHCSAEHAWHVFTHDLSAWWPVERHSLGEEKVVTCEVHAPSGGESGEVGERWRDGSFHRWAQILTWEPPERLVLAWQVNEDDPAPTEVEITFTEERAGLTRVALTHRGWERLGDLGPARRESYDAGWLPVLNRFKAKADDPEVHRTFGISLNNRVWAELSRNDRSGDDDARMVDAAHASLWHWAQCGTEVNLQRGEWLCAHVYTVLGRAEPAMHHATRTMAHTEAAPEGLEDFDHFYAALGMARALACAGRVDEARPWKEKASALLDGVVDPIDKEICEGDLASGPWFGLE